MCLFAGLVGDADFQADFKLSHRLAGRNQHDQTQSFVVFTRREVEAAQITTGRRKKGLPFRDLLANQSVIEVVF